MSAQLRNRNDVEAHADRQARLYGDIWAADPAYGTRPSDVEDTVLHRIIPHMRRVLANELPSVVDFGAGDGRFLRALAQAGWCYCGIGVDVHQPANLEMWMRWRRQPLWHPLDVSCKYVISTDTLEHMPPEMVDAVLANIARSAGHGFLRISTRQDIYGTERGLHLHETVEEPDWWLSHCRAAGIEPSSWRIYPGHAVEIWW